MRLCYRMSSTERKLNSFPARGEFVVRPERAIPLPDAMVQLVSPGRRVAPRQIASIASALIRLKQ
jgi:hypothetical protein